jgi:glucan phosphoethanolaminetransferase (alkaline phosphatase superfamily)
LLCVEFSLAHMLNPLKIHGSLLNMVYSTYELRASTLNWCVVLDTNILLIMKVINTNRSREYPQLNFMYFFIFIVKLYTDG